MVGFERRSGRTEKRHCSLQPCAIHGNVAAVVPWSFFLLVAGFLLFVDDDQAKIFERCKNSGARSNHDAGLPVPHAPPLASALHIRQAAVQHRYRFAEPRAHQAANPQSQRNFRNQHDGRLPARNRCLDCAEVNFRLAAAGDAVKQSRREFPGHEPAPNLSKSQLLLRIQYIGGRSEIRIPGIFFHSEGLFPSKYPALLFQAMDDCA